MCFHAHKIDKAVKSSESSPLLLTLFFWHWKNPMQPQKARVGILLFLGSSGTTSLLSLVNYRKRTLGSWSHYYYNSVIFLVVTCFCWADQTSISVDCSWSVFMASFMTTVSVCYHLKHEVSPFVFRIWSAMFIPWLMLPRISSTSTIFLPWLAICG